MTDITKSKRAWLGPGLKDDPSGRGKGRRLTKRGMTRKKPTCENKRREKPLKSKKWSMTKKNGLSDQGGGGAPGGGFGGGKGENPRKRDNKKQTEMVKCEQNGKKVPYPGETDKQRGDKLAIRGHRGFLQL